MIRNPSDEQAKQLWLACYKWILDNAPSCPESLFQVDSVHDALPDLAESVCEIVGYFPGESEDRPQ